MINLDMEKREFPYKTRYNSNNKLYTTVENINSRYQNGTVNINKLLNEVKVSQKDDVKKNITLIISSFLILVTAYYFIF